MLRFFVTICYFIPVLVIFFIPTLLFAYILKLFGSKEAPFRIVNWLAYVWMKIFLFITGRRLEFIPGDFDFNNPKKFVIANHTNSLEVPLVVSLPFLTKNYAARLSYLGGDIIQRYWIIPLMIHAKIVESVIYSDRNPNFRNFKKSLMGSLEENSIFLFPEGMRTYSEEIASMKTGVLKLAYKFHIDLDVFVISGMMGYSSYPKYAAMRKKRKIYFKYCGVIHAADYKNFEDMKNATENLMIAEKKKLDALYLLS